MKPSELIEELKQFQEENIEDELDVEFAYDYGDHCHNIVTENINTVERTAVIYSDYHLRNRIVDDEELDKENVKEIIVLQ